jgi:hypothetical protein
MMRKLMFVLVLVVLLTMGMATFAQAADFAGDDGGPSAVPEPATIVLLGAGLAVVAYAGWRRSRKK